jgi:glycosyltransferase involved in cell wall biosynthesis
LDALIVHGKTGRKIIEAKWDDRACQHVSVIPHGHFIQAYTNNIGCDAARAILGLRCSDFVFLFLGQIRPYKGVFDMVEAFAGISTSNARLVIAGKPLDEAIRENLERAIRRDPRIVFVPGHIQDDDVQVYMNACDVVVLPYKRIFTSGAAILAMSFGKPCIAPRTGCVVDALSENGAVFFDPCCDKDLKRALIETMTCGDKLAAMGRENLERARTLDWRAIAHATVATYERCLARP